AFWATMQAFFDRTGWSNDTSMQRVWLVVPFAPIAVERYFTSGSENSSEAWSFIDKSFDLSIFVPTPIQVGFRSYLLRLLGTAFPEHEQNVRENIRDLYDSDRSGVTPVGRAGDASATRKTPR